MLELHQRLLSETGGSARSPVSTFAQIQVAIFAMIRQQPGTLNIQGYFERNKNEEYLLHHRRSVVVVVVAGYLGVHLGTIRPFRRRSTRLIDTLRKQANKCHHENRTGRSPH